MEITLFLMTQKGYEVLNEIILNNLHSHIESIIVSRDSNIQNDYYDEIVQLSNQNEIPCYDRNSAYTISANYCIAISWRWIINLPESSKLITFHDSLLPKYRGFAPLVNMLINKEKTIGVSAIFANSEYDKGDIIEQKKIDIEYPITIQEAINKVSKLYCDLACSIIRNLLLCKRLNTIIQNDFEASYSLWRDELDYKINWKDSATTIRRFVDSVGFPYKGASTFINNDLYRILSVTEIDDVNIENRAPGKIIFIDKGKPIVVCGKGLIRIDSMVNEDGINCLPLKAFRVRFT